ncbi:endonuclease/exonuclease/phosphatase family protein [Microbulbifer sp. JMSA004]|uniref:endonuclease/exonuclease/phosphatase family protein n=1 Tax=Microbulbifer sp. JMSA004 TaxID=3243370 RepID=UPI004039E7BB
MNLSFLWWNTSLSPAGKDRSSLEHKKHVRNIINMFTTELHIDFITLGEVSDLDINEIVKNCQTKDYEVYRGFEKAGRAYFDTCVLYRRDKFKLIDSMRVTASKGGRVFKIAQRLDLMFCEHEVPLHIFISHWPSRLHMKPNDPERALLGMKLRDSIDSLIETYKDDATFILLGDYNDEPFDQSLAEHLMATRDRGLVNSKSHLLYNPFWRRIGHYEPYTSDSDQDHYYECGTYYHRAGTISRWRTFDQIIFSSNFLGRSDWHINERLTTILDIPFYKDLVINPKEHFDHFPVLGVIEKAA